MSRQRGHGLHQSVAHALGAAVDRQVDEAATCQDRPPTMICGRVAIQAPASDLGRPVTSFPVLISETDASIFAVRAVRSRL
ncbi:hypothetical protein [Nonomuraea sp. NPDC049141]|uniref:hypothetical protein n=1 Tax=unclassified Nonomuraea TaxID=2593643 RepID=UPI003400158C